MTNGEKFKTAQERTDAFNNFCRMYSDGDEMCYGCPFRDTNYKCHFAWLDLEAEEEKPLPCPFCGEETHTYKDVHDVHYVMCDCGYTSTETSNKEYAIAAHNRVAKKCMEEK